MTHNNTTTKTNLADGYRLAHQHRGLVGHPDPLEIVLRIEAGRHAVTELLFELPSFYSPEDEVDDIPRLFKVTHDEVLAVAAVPERLGGGGLCLLVVVLAMDDAGEAARGVAGDALPHREDRAAGGVHDDALALA